MRRAAVVVGSAVQVAGFPGNFNEATVTIREATVISLILNPIYAESVLQWFLIAFVPSDQQKISACARKRAVSSLNRSFP